MIGLEGGGNSARERAVQAVHYYNNKVLKAKNNSNNNTNWKQQCSTSLSTSSSQLYGKGLTKKDNSNIILHRSNSSLELLQQQDGGGNQSKHEAKKPTLKREYGSHGSIDIMLSDDISKTATSNSEQFFAMLQDYRPAVFDISSKNNNNNKKREYFMTGNKESSMVDGMANDLQDECSDKPSLTTTSPKQKIKFHRFWGGNLSGIKHSLSADSSAGLSLSYDSNVTNSSVVSSPDAVDEKNGRRAFAHYDCQSVTTKLFGNKLTNLLSKRRNTTTGASAASSGVRSSTPDGGDCKDDDNGDGRSNELIQSCPFFRNEIGGEEERIVSLTGNYSPTRGKQTATDPHHRPALSGGVSILEYPTGQTHWIGDICPYTRNTNRIENVDQGALYYRQYFYKQEHQNWFGMDENLGPVAISIKRETLDSVNAHPDNNTNTTTPPASLPLVRYRLIVRTSELQTLRGSVLEDSIPNIRSSSSNKNANTKEVIEHVVPEVQLSSLRLGINSPQTEEQLLKLDEQGISRNYKVGVLYCKAGQSTEEEMYNNEEAGSAFLEFLDTIGQTVRLKGFDKYKAGLDNKSDSTGLYSVFAQHKDYQLMFHVSTFLPFTPNNRQQLLRKRHIGNDIVTIVFQEPGAEPFTPKHIRSQFQHVFIVVQAINPCTDNTKYKIAVTRSKEAALFGPPIPKGAIFNKSQHFTDFLLTKVINGENSAHLSDKFATMATRTRQAYLKDLSSNCSSNTLLETTQKFSMLSFSNKKKERWKPRFVPDASQRGAICWQVMLEDSTNSTIIHCYLAISTDSLVLIDENTDNIVFVTPCKSILGWSTQTNSLRLYYHEGECITIHMKESGDRDELMEVVVRLRASTDGTAAQELALRRNPIGQLGFHVQPDGVVTQVENMGLAFQAGLRQGARLVEICKVAVATLTHDQMVDLLKTSLMVTVNVIPPISDGTPRRGCMIQNCRYNSNRFEGDYGDSSSPDDKLNSHTTSAAYQQPVPGNHKKLYDRSFSPPKSSNSSGYGTGSSSKSFSSMENKKYINDHEVVPNLPSGPCSDDRWYDALESESTSNQTCLSPNSLFKNNVYSKSKSDIPHSSYSLPNITGHPNSPEYSNSISPQDDKVTCIIKAERSHEVRRQLEQRTAQHFSLKHQDTTDRHPVDSITNAVRGIQIIADDRSTDSSISERAFPPSEDELSIESGSNGSPRTVGARRTGSAHLTASSSGSSRNQSPRLKDTGEPRLRAGASTSRSSNRSSTNLSSSTLQQDLMKLINPDYAATEKGSSEISKYFASSGNVDQKKVKEKSKQMGGNGKSRKSKLESDKVIVTTARPATVISNGSSSPSEHKLSMEERLSPRVTNIMPNMKRQSPCLPLPDDKEMDWSSLVDTATKAMLQVSSEEEQPQTVYSSLNPESEDDNFQEWFDEPMSQGAQMLSNLKNEKGMQEEFQKYLSELENRLMKETQKRLSLEEEVSSLRDENRRLQRESQSAAQQLRRFTEWFFQTIDKQ